VEYVFRGPRVGSCRKPSASHWETVAVAWMCSTWGKSPVAQIQSPSLSGSSGKSASGSGVGSGVGSASSSSSASSTKAGKGPVRQAFIRSASSLFAFRSAFQLAWQPTQQHGSTLLCPVGTDRNRLVPSGSNQFRPDSNQFRPDSDQNQLDSDRNRLEPLGTNRFRSVPSKIIILLSKWSQTK